MTFISIVVFQQITIDSIWNSALELIQIFEVSAAAILFSIAVYIQSQNKYHRKTNLFDKSMEKKFVVIPMNKQPFLLL